MGTAAEAALLSKRRRQTRYFEDASQTVRGVARGMDAICHLCLLVIVFAVPLMMAGIRETGVAVFIGSSLLFGVCWAVGQLVTARPGSGFSLMVIPAFLAIALVSLQLVPLPESWIRILSPFVAEYLTAWNPQDAQLLPSVSWNTISLTPNLTRSGLLLLIAYVVFFLTLLQHMRNLADVDKVLQLVAVATVGMACVGIGQLFFGNGDFLWLIHHPLRDASWPAKGTFTNQNHFAHFLALGVGPLVWCWQRAGCKNGRNIRGRIRNRGFGTSRSTESNQQAIGFAITIVVLAGVLSFSRGGICSIAIALATAFAAFGRQWAATFRLIVPAAVFIAIAATMSGTELLHAKWQQLMKADSLMDLSHGRFVLWSSLASAVPYFWPAGAGVGSHPEVYPVWMKTDFGKRFSHAESGYLQVLIETGLPGLILVVAAIGLCVYWAVAAFRCADDTGRPRVMVLSSGLAVSGLHSITDFVWYIPACLILTLILGACLCRTYQLSVPQTNPGIRRAASISWSTCWALILVVAVPPMTRANAGVVVNGSKSESAWLRYRGVSVEAGHLWKSHSIAAYDDRLDAMVRSLEKCVEHDSRHCRAWSDLASFYVRRFERNQETASNPVSLQEVRNTVKTSEFNSPREIFDWLNRAFESNATDLYRAQLAARRAVQGQPLKGSNYLLLAQLGFLTQTHPDCEDALIEQALRLRPFEASVLYFVGTTEIQRGSIDKGCEWWRKAYQLSADFRPLIINGLAVHMSPAETVKRINPDAEGLWQMFRLYQQQQAVTQANWVAGEYARRFQEFSENGQNPNAQFWLHSREIFASQQQRKQTLHCLNQAVRLLPANYQLRKEFGLLLLAAEAKDDAVRELEWCLLRNPDDREIKDAIAAIKKSLSEGEDS